MEIAIRHRPVFDVTLTEKTVDRLIFLSQHHYDSRCRAASADGGFLPVWKRVFHNFPSTTVEAKPDEFDTLIKCAEMATALNFGEDEGKAQADIFQFTMLASAAMRKSGAWA